MEDYDPELDEDDFDEGASGGRGGARGAGSGGDPYSAGEKKKVGRPIAYRGDPNAPHLTEEERRRIKRCPLWSCGQQIR